MNVISLFDGMGCLYMALKESGVKIDKYYASEIEKQPIEFTKKNYPDIEHLGDVTRWKEWDIDWKTIDFIGAGSPCQGFSFAGKQLNFEDERSKLFFVFVEILEHCKSVNPNVKFLLENVIMKKEYQNVINETLELFPVNINSNLVSAQNRNRLYWSNIKTKPVGLFGEIHTDIPQPKDEKIFLKDVLQPESEVDEKYYLSDKAIDYLKRDTTGNYSDRLAFMNYDYKNKSVCLTANHHKGVPYNMLCVVMRGRNIVDGKRKDYKGAPTEQRLEANESGKTNCLTSVQKDNLLMLNERQKANHKNEDEKANTFLSTSWKGSQANGMTLVGTTKLRRLTPEECMRLQTIPEWVSREGFSDTAIYKMCGNGWTIKVITHILSFL